jgi:serine/threonine-protein kinase
VRVVHGSGAAEPAQLLVATWATADGLAAEVHHLGGAVAHTAAPTLGDVDGPERVGMYRIVKEIGRGGMGVVYRAEHVALERPVALKVLAPEAASNAALASQFLVEARAACRARHPGIVDVTDFGHLADGRPYLVMELVEAPTLASELRREGAFAPARAVALARRIASALEAASRQGVVHRDLTPSNVFVLEGDKVKIGDFGLARIVDASRAPAAADPTEGGNVMGTATYMSPEQARGEPGDSRSDIYALGCILFKMLTGQAPFSGSELEILAQHATTPFPPMVGPDGAIPESVERIVLRATAKRPEERYQSLSELTAELTRVARMLSRDDWRRWLPR